MKAVRKHGNSTKIDNIPQPQITNDDSVLIRVQVAGLCRTDINVSKGKIKSSDPITLGHEFSGTIERVGSAVFHLHPGDRVAVMPIIPCGRCRSCKNRLFSSCQDTAMLGVDLPGAFAEFVTVPSSQVYLLPDEASFFWGAYCEPIAASLAVIKTGISTTERGAILGANRIATLTAKILNALGYKNITILNTNQDPPDQEESLLDFVIETIASSEVMTYAVRSIRPQGKLILKSRQFNPVKLIPNTLVKKELTICAVNYGSFSQALELASSGILELDDLIGETYELKDFPLAFEKEELGESKKQFFQIGN